MNTCIGLIYSDLKFYLKRFLENNVGGILGNRIGEHSRVVASDAHFLHWIIISRWTVNWKELITQVSHFIRRFYRGQISHGYINNKIINNNKLCYNDFRYRNKVFQCFFLKFVRWDFQNHSIVLGKSWNAIGFK